MLSAFFAALAPSNIAAALTSFANVWTWGP